MQLAAFCHRCWRALSDELCANSTRCQILIGANTSWCRRLLRGGRTLLSINTTSGAEHYFGGAKHYFGRVEYYFGGAEHYFGGCQTLLRACRTLLGSKGVLRPSQLQPCVSFARVCVRKRACKWLCVPGVSVLLRSAPCVSRWAKISGR